MQLVSERRFDSIGNPIAGPKRITGFQWVNPVEDPLWDAALPPHHVFFHTSAWAKVLNQSYGCRPMYLAAVAAASAAGSARSSNQDQFRLLLPLMELRSPITGNRGVCLPFTDECVALVSNKDELRGTSEHLLALARAKQWKFIEWRGTDPAMSGSHPSVSFYTHDLDLLSEDNALLNRFDDSVRRAIRKAESEGVDVRISTAREDLHTYYRLHCRTRKRHGLPPQPWGFFESIFQHVLSRGHGVVVLAFYQGQPIAGAVFFHTARTALYKYGASDMRFQHSRPNNLVMWRAIQWYGRHGFSELNFGRTSFANEGLCRFKAGFGAHSRVVQYYKYDLRKNRFVSDVDRASGWHNHVFRRMPLPLARLLGSILYRHWD